MNLFQKENKDIDQQILLFVEDSDLFSFLSIKNKYIYSLCENENFWKNRAQIWFGKEFFDFKNKNKNKPHDTFKNTYQLFRELQSLILELELDLSVDEIFNLKELNLSYHMLVELPDTIGNLSKLEAIYLGESGLEKLPDSIGNLSNLKMLYLAFTRLKELPNTIGNLSKLEEIYLHSTSLKELPDTIGNLSNLKELSLPHQLRCNESIKTKLKNYSTHIFY